MKLFGEFEAVEFSEENLILITHRGYIYYIYNRKYKRWKKYRNAGNDCITVKNYPDVSRLELADALDGAFPKSETAFMRRCRPSQLNIGDMLALLIEDYPRYLSDREIHSAVQCFLAASVIRHKSSLKLRELLDKALARPVGQAQALARIKKLSFAVIGRDIFKEEIEIVDGHNNSSYFWFRPVRIIDYSDTGDSNNVAEMNGVEFSIEETDVDLYLTPFLYKHYDGTLGANIRRDGATWTVGDGNRFVTLASDFEWNLTHNFYTHEAMGRILNDIANTIDDLLAGRETEYTIKLAESDTETALIVDFFHRFTYRMEFMLRVSEEKGYDLISVMGP